MILLIVRDARCSHYVIVRAFATCSIFGSIVIGAKTLEEVFSLEKEKKNGAEFKYKCKLVTELVRQCLKKEIFEDSIELINFFLIQMTR